MIVSSPYLSLLDSLGQFELGSVQNYYFCMQELKREEQEQNTEVTNAYVEWSNVGTRLGGDF